MGRRVKRKNTLRKNTGRKNTRRVNRKNTRRVNRKNTRRVNRKNTRRVNRKNNLKKNKLFGGVKGKDSILHCQGLINNDKEIPGTPGEYGFKYEGCHPNYTDRGQYIHFIIEDKSNGVAEYKLATYYGFNRKFRGPNEYTFLVDQDSHPETYRFKGSDVHKACVISWTHYEECENGRRKLDETFSEYTDEKGSLFEQTVGDVAKKQAVVAAFEGQ